MSFFDEIAPDLPQRQRLVYVASAMRRRVASQRPGETDELAKELAELSLLVCTELEIAQHRVGEAVRAIGDALGSLDRANPERSSDMRAIEGATRTLGAVFEREVKPALRLRVGMDGSVCHAPWTADNPFAAITASGFRTQTCVHCGRTCGDYDGGMALVNGQPLCHPNAGGRPDCLKAATSYSHPLHDCDTCKRNESTDPETEEAMP